MKMISKNMGQAKLIDAAFVFLVETSLRSSENSRWNTPIAATVIKTVRT